MGNVCRRSFACVTEGKFVTELANADPSPDADDDDDEGSVTRIIRRMQKGDGDGAELLWERFYVRLKYLMKDRLRDRLHLVADEEDMALESLAEMFRGLLEGKYPSLDSRESFWRLLVTGLHTERTRRNQSSKPAETRVGSGLPRISVRIVQ